MRRTLLLGAVLALCAIALTAPPGDTVISATYLEEVSYVDATHVQAPTGMLFAAPSGGPDSTDTILRELLDATVGVHGYWLAAADVRGNAATHRASLRVDDPIGVTLSEPSSGGFSDTARFSVVISTQTDASCEWDFLSLQAPEYKAMAGGGTSHAIQDFSTRYRFARNEAVPLIIRCQTPDALQTVRVVEVGWSTDPLGASSEMWPVPVADPDSGLLIQASSDYATLCALDSELLSSPIQGFWGRQHVFDGLSTGYQGLLFEVLCVNARGEQLPQQELSERQDFSGQELAIRLAAPRYPVDTRTPVLSVDTNLVARCSQDLGSPSALGPLASGRSHQRQITLTEGDNSGTVTCTTSEGVTASLPISITVDTQDPVARMSQAPEICGGDIIVSLSAAGSGSLAYVQLETALERVLRQWPTGSDTFVLRQGGMSPSDGGQLTVRGVDAAGNVGPSQSVAMVQRPDTQECAARGIVQQLRLLEPPEGATDADAFDLSIGSELPSTCEWRTTGSWTPFSEATERTHTVTDFQQSPGVTRAAETGVDVQCTDAAGATTQESFTIAWDLDVPVIQVSADPQDVSDITRPFSVVTVTADQQVRCGYDNGGLTQDYAAQHLFNVSIPYGVGERDVQVRCVNRADKQATGSVRITESYPSSMRIIVDTPDISLSGSVSLSVRTSLLASCTATAENEQYVLDSGDDVVHQRPVTLSEGRYDILYQCTDLSAEGGTAETIKRLIVDKTLPELDLTAKALTCGLSSYAVTGSVSDNIGIKQVRLSFAGKEYAAQTLPFTIKGLELTAGQTYTLSVEVEDLAGNVLGPIDAQVQAQEADGGACDVQPPRVNLRQQEGNGFVRVWIECRDDAGCADTYGFGTGESQGACTLADYSLADGEIFRIEQTSKACWKVADVNGNVVEDSEIIEVVDRPDSCFDGVLSGDETDVDCGGSCAPCDANGPVCDDDGDCDDDEICGGDNTCWTPGGSCSSDDDCADEGVCVEGICYLPPDGEDDSCVEDADCAAEDQICGNDNTCWEDTGAPCDATEDCVEGQVCNAGSCYAPIPPTDPQAPTCNTGADCASGVCDASGYCQANDCENGVLDGTETDVDCGGFTCEPCGDGLSCEVRFDCQSNNCQGGVCVGASCDDGLTNGDETGIDCGGSCTDRCENGKGCDGDEDCVSGICSSGTCSSTRLDRDDPDDFEPPDIEDPGFVDEGATLWGIILIVLGIVCVLGGSGYIYYERSHTGGAPRSRPNSAFDFEEPSFGSDTSTSNAQQAAPQEPDLDFSDSQLRETARKKRRKVRRTKRKQLLSEFETGEQADADQSETAGDQPDEQEASQKEAADPEEQGSTAQETEDLRIDPDAVKKPTPKQPKPEQPVKSVEERGPHSEIGSEEVHRHLEQSTDKEDAKRRAKEMADRGADKHEVSSALADLRAMGRIDDEDIDELRDNLDL